MIHEVDEGLRRMLSAESFPGGEIELVFDAPTRAWAARRTAPTINVFLYDIREDAERRRTNPTEEFAADGVTIVRREPPRWFQLSYLVSAWTTRPQDEHRLLSAVLSCLIEHDELPAAHLEGTLAGLGLGVPIDAAGPVGENRSAADLWSALGGELKAAVDLRVLAPLAGRQIGTAPPVTDGLVMRTRDSRSDAESARIRRLRYQNQPDPEVITPPDPTEGLGATRPRPTGRGPRRRGGRIR
ncbi:DUF4255 domain-containing protein [Actinoalloteichus hymeniacidonis]|uniref:DUF4255 family protein n=1 Tax=Actinoalloteichus hymeniacidonis TaxID=340345 RepID=A0AAC9HS01_9PSEU|nr:DUF4255 domain-containing protein [Actinoalloteichus hymeniacidonis]AOS64313.1 putative DUF4255 family protein [Actinoalloteichus hymeniacidonis]MBB5907619.1 hypothetical protein [Actinoalloteichus hymeniacidonis]